MHICNSFQKPVEFVAAIHRQLIKHLDEKLVHISRYHLAFYGKSVKLNEKNYNLIETMLIKFHV